MRLKSSKETKNYSRKSINPLVFVRWVFSVTRDRLLKNNLDHRFQRFDVNLLKSTGSPMVTICTNRFNIHNSTFCPHSVFMCFVWIWEQTVIIYLYSINWLVFITETACVYCAVRTGSLYIILRSAHTVYFCVLCGSENKQQLFPYTALTDWFL